MGGFLVAGLLVAAAVAGWQLRRTEPVANRPIPRGALYGGGGVLVVALLLYFFIDGLADWL